ncbi:hypothetical protein PHMEG_00033054 [Phytophthora megakarya]|uniref:Integrase catalytic domain-containing protein n=1 Tax=Phytophthora megakarya TaxID=4795 RepID=A0A225UUL8_9STRA|nr:hypothetical protein PHMEG_00033054 [Phytophthora megakarya]
MLTRLANVFSIERPRAHVERFLAKCLLCLHVKGGKSIPIPQTRNEALHFDFLYLDESFGDNQYVLALKDDTSHFCELIACESPTSAVVANAILQWHSRFGVPKLWISDQGSHFTSEIVDTLQITLKCDNEFSVAYCPWINGSIEWTTATKRVDFGGTVEPKPYTRTLLGLQVATRAIYGVVSSVSIKARRIKRSLAQLRESEQNMQRAVSTAREKQRLLN